MMMRADGSGRHRLTEFGSPFWSPFGRELLINSYSLPSKSTLFNLETRKGGVIEVPDHQVFSWPSWVGPRTVVTALAPKETYEGDSIVLLDVSEPAEAKILEVLWKRDADLDVVPRWPVFRPGTNQCSSKASCRKRKAVRRSGGRSIRSSGVNPCEPNPWGWSDKNTFPDRRELASAACPSPPTAGTSSSTPTDPSSGSRDRSWRERTSS